MARLSPLVLIPPLAFAGLAAMFLWGMGRDDPQAIPSALIGQQAPAVPTTTLPVSYTHLTLPTICSV